MFITFNALIFLMNEVLIFNILRVWNKNVEKRFIFTVGVVRSSIKNVETFHKHKFKQISADERLQIYN